MGLRKELRFLLLMTIIFSIINNYITIFINLYIWEGHHKISQVAWFNVAMLAFWSIAFLVGGKLFTLYSLRVTTKISSLAAVVAFVFLLTLHDVPSYVWNLCVGGCVGVMCGTYFMSQNMLISFFGKGEDFKTYFSMFNIAQQIISIINPILFAMIIKWFGYSASFGIMCAIICVLFALTFYIPQATVTKEDKEKPFFRVNNPFGRLNQLKTFLISCIVMGLVLQFQVLFVQLFTFSLSDNKIIIGSLNVLYTVITIVAFRISRRIQAPVIRWLKFGGVLMVLSYLIALYPSPTIFVIINIFSTLGYFFVTTNWNASQFSYLSQFQSTALTKSMIAREISLNVGRMLMLCLITQVEDFKGSIYGSLIIFSVLCVGLMLLVEQKRLQFNASKEGSGVSA
jgi:MFS transporter, YQGE family, putative transporter